MRFGAGTEIGRSQFHLARTLRFCIKLAGQRGGLLALRERDRFVHLHDGWPGLRQPSSIGQREQRIGAFPIARHHVAIEMRDAEQILRTRIAPAGGAFYVGQRFGPAAILKQHQPISICRLHMPGLRRALVQSFGAPSIQRHAAPQPVSLRQIEHCIGIARFGGALPFTNSSGIITPAPRFHPVAHICSQRGSHRQGAQRCHA